MIGSRAVAEDRYVRTLHLPEDQAIRDVSEGGSPWSDHIARMVVQSF